MRHGSYLMMATPNMDDNGGCVVKLTRKAQNCAIYHLRSTISYAAPVRGTRCAPEITCLKTKQHLMKITSGGNTNLV